MQCYKAPCRLPGLISTTNELIEEREQIQKQKEELLKRQLMQQQEDFEATLGGNKLPVPVKSRLTPLVPSKREIEGKWSDDRYMDNTMDSGLGVAGTSKRQPSASSRDIIPEAKSFEDLEAMISAKTKKRKEEMKERNRGFVKPKQW